MVQGQWSLPETEQSARDLLNALLEAQTEADVHACLDKAGMLDDDLWQPYGGDSNNSGTFANQQASPRGALVEKIVNSIDAVLMAKAFEKGDLPDGSPPASMFEAAERYFGVREGRLAEIAAAQRREMARTTVQVVLSGHRAPGRPTITIVDHGEGQEPAEFPNTLVSLSKDNKLRIPFVQGKFNMGSTGAVRFCGPQHNYQLILSRRHVEAPGSDTRWGFTVVRRHWAEGNRAPQYQYLAPAEMILCFEAAALPILTRADGGWADLQHGTLVRLYEYDIEERTTANFDFSRMLNRRLYRLPVPVQVVERRDFRRQSNEEIVPGLGTLLEEGARDSVEPGFPTGDTLPVPGVGRVVVTLVPFRDDASTRNWLKAAESIIFTVNGQAHAFERRDLLRRAGANGVNLHSSLAGSLLVEVDCSDLAPPIHFDLFMGSRDRMPDNEKTRALLTALLAYLRGHPGLRELNHRRREDAFRKSRESDSTTRDLFVRMLESSPAMAAILSGRSITVPKPAPPPPVFEGSRFPTYLRWERGGPEVEKHCPANKYCYAELETDAANGFLTRDAERGLLFVEPEEWRTGDERLWNGKLRVKLEPPPGTEVGTEVPLRITILSEGIPADLTVGGRLIVDPEEPETPPRPRPDPKPRVAPPDIRLVWQEEWDAHGFDAQSVTSVLRDNRRTTVYVNMDNRGLEIYRRGERRRKSELERMWEISVVPLAIALESAIEKEELEREVAEKALSAMSDVLLPAVDFAAKVAQEAE